MAKILFVTPYYPPEITPPAIRISETARLLVKSGHQVTILTAFPNFPTGIIPPEYRGYRKLEEVREGIRIIRVWSYVSPNKGFLRRILSQLSFGCLSPFLSWRAIGHPDVIIVESPPLFDAIAGRFLAWLKRCPFIFTVADLWPESAIQLGMLHNRTLIRLAQWLEWSTYQRAGAVWALTSGIRQILIERGLPLAKVFVSTNSVDTKLFYPRPQTQARAELGWDERFTVLYAGNHGLAYSLTTMLEAAALLKDERAIQFVLVGNGVKKAELIEQVQRDNLTNVIFLDPVPHERMPLLLAASDVSLILLRQFPLVAGVLPAKMLEIMACGRPFILAAQGLSHQLAVEEAQAALAIERENAQALKAALLSLRDQPELAQTLGQRGRAFVQARFERSLLTRELETRLLNLLQQHRPLQSTCKALKKNG